MLLIVVCITAFCKVTESMCICLGVSGRSWLASEKGLEMVDTCCLCRRLFWIASLRREIWLGGQWTLAPAGCVKELPRFYAASALERGILANSEAWHTCLEISWVMGYAFQDLGKYSL